MNKIVIIISCLFTALFSQAQIRYTPQTAAGYEYKYLKADSGFAVSYRDTTIGRGTARPGSIVCRPQDSLFYGYNGLRWVKLGNDAIGSIEKVDSVTITAGVLYYWINGVSTGVTLPVGFALDLQQVTDNGAVTTNNISANVLRANAGVQTFQQSALDYLIETATPAPGIDQWYRGQIKGDSISNDGLKWYLPDTSGVFVTSVNGQLPNKKGQVTILSGGGGSFDTTTIYNNLALKVNISDTAAMLSNYVNDAGNGLQKLSDHVVGLGGTLNQHTVIDGDGGLRRFNIQNVQYFRAATTTGGNLGVTGSGIDASGNYISIYPSDSLMIPNLSTNAGTNYLLGGKDINGRVTKVNLGSGLALLSGVLTNTAPLGTDTSTVVGFGLEKSIASNVQTLKVDSNLVATKYSTDVINAQVIANTSAITQRVTYANLTDSLNQISLSKNGTNDSTILQVNGRRFAAVDNVGVGGSGITYPNTANAYLNGYGNFPTLNTDSITQGTTNQFSKWAVSGSDIYNTNAGDVGIGTSTPNAKFQVVDDVSKISISTGAGAVTPNISTINTGLSGKAAALGAGTSGAYFSYDNNGSFFIMSENRANFDANATGFGNIRMSIAPNGDVSIASLTTNGYVKTSGGTGTLVSSAAIPQADVTNLTTDLSAKQANITMQDEGAAQGAAGANTIINFTGAGVTATNSGNTLTVNVSGGGGGGDALTSNPLSQFASTTSAQLAGVISDESGTGNLVLNTSPTITSPNLAGEIDLTGITSPSQYTSDQTDVSYTGSTIIRVSTNSDNRIINSIAGGTDGRMIKIINTGSSDLILQSDDGSTGTAANRFDFNNVDVIIEPKESREFIYDATLSRWLKTTYEYDLTNMRRQPMYNWDYMVAGVATANFPTTAVASGTATYINTEAAHPGYMTTTSSTTTNSGHHSYYLGLQTNLFFQGGETYECIYQPKVASNTNTTTRFGFLDATTSADAVDGAYFEIPAGSFNVVGKTANNSTRTTSATIATLSVNTWYRFVIKVNRAASSISFTIYDANGVSLGTQSNTANIPTTSARVFGAGYISTNVGTTATLLGWLDYQAFQLGAGKAILR